MHPLTLAEDLMAAGVSEDSPFAVACLLTTYYSHLSREARFTPVALVTRGILVDRAGESLWLDVQTRLDLPNTPHRIQSLQVTCGVRGETSIQGMAERR